MAADQELLNQLADELEKARDEMREDQWKTWMRSLPQAEREAAAKKRLDVGTALLAAKNAQLQGIVAALQANETALRNGISALAAARGAAQDFQKHLKAVGDVLNVAAKVFKILT
ncbi:MAG: hypothetical protein FJX47_07880 [Alphaproteobacteria bacterium]|nr:hypothetical protein [Alphaproteobacteria bacterium]